MGAEKLQNKKEIINGLNILLKDVKAGRINNIIYVADYNGQFNMGNIGKVHPAMGSRMVAELTIWWSKLVNGSKNG